MSECSSYEIALKINNVLSKIQAELKCGVCRSTFTHPVSATCNHVFCKNCLDQVFLYRRVVECPICRKKINKRSCTASEQHESIVKGYLQIGHSFRCDLQEQAFSIPSNIAYIESQVPSALLNTAPLQDFRPTPQFVLPKIRERRKQSSDAHVNSKVSKFDKVNDESLCKGSSFELSEHGTQRTRKDEMSVNPRSDNQPGDIQHASTKSVHVQCNIPDPFCHCQSLRKSIEIYRERFTCCPSDLHAAFQLVPGLENLLAEVPLSRHFDDVEVGNQLRITERFAACDTPSGIVKKSEKPSSSSLLSHSTEVAPQFCELNEVDVEDDNMNITIQMAFESCPDEEKENINTNSSIVISVSRPACLEDEDLVHKFLSMFPNVQFKEEIDSSSTHLVMMNAEIAFIEKNSYAQKSLRYLFAVAHKCEVVVREWLEECLRTQTLLATTSYELSSDKTGGELGWIRARRISEPLFEQMSFFLPQLFSDSRLLPRKKLKELIAICGGTCYDKPWDIDNVEKSYTIFMPHSTEVNAARRYQASMRGVPVLVADWVLDSVAAYRIMPVESYKIC
ncbi:zinc finger, C3HC4 type [Dictyocaulus viviparus]|uniref:Zinc finger, C3HC4 type n=1 Tax=Dictyocaulus viviparus TaxID=29172 RepID=A0A0D8XHU4_DICVI|nr:zinc finger, C3HC4 type [Dictyocaulus viviparus]